MVQTPNRGLRRRFSALLSLAVLLPSAPGWAQVSILQGGPFTVGHIPVYSRSGSAGQPLVIDSGPAGSNKTGQGVGELNITALGTGSPPFAGQGTGQYGTVVQIQDAVATNPTGYHYLGLSANSQGGGLLTYGAAGGAAQLPFNFIVNGTKYQFPFVAPGTGVIGPPTTVVNDLACWNNMVGTLLKDCGAIPVPGGSSGQAQFNNGGTFGGFSGLTISGGALQTVTVTPPPGLAQAFNSTTQQGTGTVSGPTSLNEIKVFSDNINAGSFFVNGLTFSQYFGGAAASGGREALVSALYLTAPTSAASGNRNYVALTGLATAMTADGGTNPATAPTSKGAIFGLGAAGVAQNGATALLNVTGAEIDVALQAGSSAWAKSIAQFALRDDDAVNGSGINAGLWIYAAGGATARLNDGILIDDDGSFGHWPISTTGTVLRTGSAGTALNGIDLRATTFTNRAFTSQNFFVLNDGTVSAGNNLVQLTSNPNGAIKLGGVSLQPFIDFNSSASVNSYDVRMQVSGGNASNGNGVLSIQSATLVNTGQIVSNGATAGVGYTTGAGGTVTQITSKATAVALNRVSGQITMNNANLVTGTIVSFTLTDTAITATDVLILNHISGGTAGAYTLNAQCAGGSATINVRNNTAGDLAEAIVIQFAVIKGANG